MDLIEMLWVDECELDMTVVLFLQRMAEFDAERIIPAYLRRGRKRRVRRVRENLLNVGRTATVLGMQFDSSVTAAVPETEAEVEKFTAAAVRFYASIRDQCRVRLNCLDWLD